MSTMTNETQRKINKWAMISLVGSTVGLLIYLILVIVSVSNTDAPVSDNVGGTSAQVTDSSLSPAVTAWNDSVMPGLVATMDTDRPVSVDVENVNGAYQVNLLFPDNLIIQASVLNGNWAITYTARTGTTFWATNGLGNGNATMTATGQLVLTSGN